MVAVAALVWAALTSRAGLLSAKAIVGKAIASNNIKTNRFKLETSGMYGIEHCLDANRATALVCTVVFMERRLKVVNRACR
jgi:hypothetical protein